MKRGWLVINSFVKSEKFSELYSLLKTSFFNKDVELEVKKASDINLSVDTKLTDKPDFVIFWDKDIYLAQRLESAGCKLFNTAKAVELCDNKILMYQELSKFNVRIPKTFVPPKTFDFVGYSDLSFVDEIVKEIGYPFVIKEAYGSFGQQVYLIKDKKQLLKVIKKIGYKDFLIQEFIQESAGKDIRINVVGDKVVASMLRENKNDFRSNITNGGVGQVIEPKQSYKDLAIKAAKCLGLDFAGVDVLIGKDNEPIICELNSNPHFKSTLIATGVNIADYIVEHILKNL